MSKRIVLLGATLLLLLPGMGRASNYFLDQVRVLFSTTETKRLQRVGVYSTDEMARRGATPKAREDLSRATGISARRLSTLAELSDLMRLRGVGPDAARILRASGVRSLAELRQADPALLADEIKRVNDRAHLSTNPPRAENLVVWIAQAKYLPSLYQPDES